MAHLAFKRVDTLLVLVHDAVPPSDEEWARYMASCKQLDADIGGDFARASALIFTDGGAPNGKQRVEIAKMLNGRVCASAVVTEVLGLRLALGAFAMINTGLKVFPSKDWKKAAAFARVDEARHLEVLKVALGLSREVGDVKVLRAIGL